ncbi:hypothetical protein CC117_00200 [Parafrankia colletiae]|uniref:2'-5' RNA ligase n=1 Tax=Parafrankia colletiae TaxID=573497 RepID=A0A1S1RJ33_9ACTN|nr:hypothetical protein [Frankia sp. Cpl3]OHV46136.1 hypothetical protein CC117_00200 [Parafrankia colletiae]
MPRSAADRAVSPADHVLDVVLLPSPELSAATAGQSRSLAGRMRQIGNPSHFALGSDFPAGDAAVCAPHVSLFMFVATDADLPAVLAALADVASGVPPLDAVGARYAHNPHGAPELYFERSAAWFDLQRLVVSAFEPIRRGRLREVDPAGTPLSAVLADGGPRWAARRRQLLAYGYDEITDEVDDLFHPHITLAWPERAEPRVELGPLGRADGVRVTFDRLAVCGMSAWGTCTTLVGAATTTGRCAAEHGARPGT